MYDSSTESGGTQKQSSPRGRHGKSQNHSHRWGEGGGTVGEEEKVEIQRECVSLQQKVEELRNREWPEIDMVSCRTKSYAGAGKEGQAWGDIALFSSRLTR